MIGVSIRFHRICAEITDAHCETKRRLYLRAARFCDIKKIAFGIRRKKQKMKRFLTVCGLVLCLCLTVTGCNKESKITLGDYKGITYTPVSTEVQDKEIQAALNKVISDATTYKTDESRAGTPVKDGDWLLLDYSGSLKETGEVFSGGTARDQRLQIGSGKFIPGFEDALIGKLVGESTSISVTFPENYAVNSAMAGKEAVFAVTVKEVQIPQIPELTDELVSKHTDGVHKTIESYKEYLTEYLKQDKEAAAKEAITAEVMEKVIANTTFDRINKKDVDEYYDSVISYYNTIAMHFGVTLESYVSYYYDKSLDEFYKEVEKIAEDTIKEQLVLDAIIEKEGISLSDEKYQELVKDYMEQYEYTDQKEFETDYTVENLRQSMLYDLAIEFILDNAVPAEES